jgi:hypothetical protein
LVVAGMNYEMVEVAFFGICVQRYIDWLRHRELLYRHGHRATLDLCRDTFTSMSSGATNFQLVLAGLSC